MGDTKELSTGAPTYLQSEIATVRFHAELRSLEVLSEFWDKDLHDTPVDVTSIAIQEGAKVWWADLDEVESFLYCAVGSAPEITVNENLSTIRKRFAVAHELGHLMHIRDGGPGSEHGYVDRSASFSSELLLAETTLGGTQPVAISAEAYANCFAVALLMPRYLFAPLVSAGWNDEKIARRFNVSTTLVQYRKAVVPQ